MSEDLVAASGRRFSVGARLVYAFDEPAEVLLLIEAACGPDQSVQREILSITPDVAISRSQDPTTGERRAIFKAAGHVTIAYDAEIEVAPRSVSLRGLPATAVADLPPDTLRFLHPSRYCQSDLFEALVSSQFGSLEGGDRVLAIADWVFGNVAYVAGGSDSRTTAMDTVVSRVGVCRDFAHLVVTLCRASDIPARVVSAYAWGLEPPDMHAVAEVFLAGEWRLVDATRKAPIEGLVRVSTGLDAADVAFMTIFGAAQLVEQSFYVSELSADLHTLPAVA